MSQIYSFSQAGCTTDKSVWERCGKRGQRALELAEMKLPVVPGFILDARLCARIERTPIKNVIQKGLEHIEKEIGRKYGDAENPLLIKVVCSSNLSLPIYPTVFNIGLSPKTMSGFARMMGEEAAWFEYCYLLRTAGIKIFDIPEAQFVEIEKKHDRSVEGQKACAEEMRQLVGADNIPEDPVDQLEVIIKQAVKRYYDPDLDEDDNVAVMVQGMVFGNLTPESSVGMYYTRNIITGEDKMQGSYLKNAYTLDRSGQDIHGL
ncbi:MAG: hypothetical protein KDK34_09785, partial [Leptospiraceae bacterium]|nr:hypothetical protein [Leptospiraceae bacterium]